MNTFNTSWYVC